MQLDTIKTAHVITLGGDRYEQFLRQQVIQSLPFELRRYNGIDGTKCQPPTWWTWGAGAWGCYQSHRNLIEEAINTDAEHLLILEDDCQFCDGFCDRLKTSLAELPDDWDVYYLGCEQLNRHNYYAEYVSPTLIRPGNANRTHAWLLSRAGLAKIYKHLCNTKEWQPRQHLDHRMGVLHERREVDCYASLPTLCYQAESVSVLNGKLDPLRTWDNNNFVRDVPLSKNINLVFAWTGFGSPGFCGQYGYEERADNTLHTDTTTLLSVHAPSSVVVDCRESVDVSPRLGRYLRASVPVRCFVDGQQVATLQERDARGNNITLSAGWHSITFDTQQRGNGACQTLLVFDDAPVVSAAAVSPAASQERTIGIEVITNTQCGKHCPGCNQSALMEARPNYEFTLSDAAALIATLKETNTKARLYFSGGEPADWKLLAKVLKFLRESDRIVYTQIATSCVDAKTITRLKKYCDLVCCSIRADQAELLTKQPEWLQGCRLWDQREHVISGPAVENVACACAAQGIECCLIGQQVYACTLAASMQIAGRWGDIYSGSASLADWIKHPPFDTNGKYTACKICTNNRYYREAGTRVATYSKPQQETKE